MDVFRNLVKARLATESAQDEHVSADLLNAFSERTLGDVERRRVFSHLASCSGCREALSLSLPELASTRPSPEHVPSRSRWRFSAPLRWGSALAALTLAVTTGIVIEQHRAADTRSARLDGTTSAQLTNGREEAKAITPDSLAPAAVKSYQNSAKVAARKAAAATAPISRAAENSPAVGTKEYDAFQNAPAEIARESAKSDSRMSAAMAASANQVARSAQTSPESVDVMAQAPAAQSGALSSKAVSARGLSAVPGAPKTGSATLARWAVSSSGQLVRDAPDGVLTNIEPASGMLFRAVAAEGIEVWAGGVEAKSSDARGVLFHSSDAGETWTRTDGPWKRVVSQLSLASPGVITVTAEDGKWKSSDGGQSWTAAQ